MALQLFFDIALIFIIASACTLLSRALKQPLIIGYILAGFIIGPLLGLITNYNNISFLVDFGIAFLLFLVGIEINEQRLKDLGIVAILTGLGQIIFTFAITYFFTTLLNFSTITSLIIAFALTLSSTVLIIKLYADKDELDTLHGRTILGMLLVQDIAAIIALTLITNTATTLTTNIASTIITGIGITLIIFLAGRTFFSRLLNYAATNIEQLTILSIGWAFFAALLADHFGFSAAIGAFAAGISISSTPYTLEISSRIKPLRDFFIVIFFVTTGMSIATTELAANVSNALILSAFIIIGNPLIIMAVMTALGFRSRTSFISGISMAQISEFSLIFVAAAAAKQLIPLHILGLTTLIAVITFITSSYFITYSRELYNFMYPWLRQLDKLTKNKYHFNNIQKNNHPELLLIGCNRAGHKILRQFKRTKKTFLVIDINPFVVERLINAHVQCIYGDINDTGTLEQFKTNKLQVIASTIPNEEHAKYILHKFKRKKTLIILTANNATEALRLYDQGADYVIIPHLLGGDHAALIINDGMHHIHKLLRHKKRHLKELQQLKENTLYVPSFEKFFKSR